MGLMEFKSFLNLVFSAAFRTKSELLLEEDKHDLVKPETTTKSMAVSSLWTSLPRAKMSPGLDLSPLRWEGSMRTLEAGKTAPPGSGLDSTSPLRARFTTS